MYRNNLSRSLLAYTADLGINQAELCRRAGILHGLMSQVIRKNKPLPEKYMDAVIKALELSPAKAGALRRAADEARAEAKADAQPYVRALKQAIERQQRELAALRSEVEQLRQVLAMGRSSLAQAEVIALNAATRASAASVRKPAKK